MKACIHVISAIHSSEEFDPEVCSSGQVLTGVARLFLSYRENERTLFQGDMLWGTAINMNVCHLMSSSIHFMLVWVISAATLFPKGLPEQMCLYI